MTREELIEKQLSKVSYADLSNFDKSTNTYYIKRVLKTKFEVNQIYVVKLKDSLFENELLKVNYNQNTVPPHKLYMIDVINILGKVIKVNAVEYDLNLNKPLVDRWSGYLTIKDIEVIKK